MAKDDHIKRTMDMLVDRRMRVNKERDEIDSAILLLDRLLRIEKTETPPANPEMTEIPTPKFKSVYRGQDYRDGRPCYTVKISEKGTKQPRYLGSFDNIYLAAARVAEYHGDEAEADRLRKLAELYPTTLTKQQMADMAEQAENNPDRPTSARK
jgi:hypothetical protein